MPQFVVSSADGCRGQSPWFVARCQVTGRAGGPIQASGVRVIGTRMHGGIGVPMNQRPQALARCRPSSAVGSPTAAG